MEIEETITLTESAQKKIKSLMLDDSFDSSNIVGLRIYVTGGGCSGFNYGFEFATDIKPDDVVIENDDITVVVDPMSIMYIAGSTVDYSRDLLNERFIVNNPKATGTCGCGSSFTV